MQSWEHLGRSGNNDIQLWKPGQSKGLTALFYFTNSDMMMKQIETEQQARASMEARIKELEGKYQ